MRSRQTPNLLDKPITQPVKENRVTLQGVACKRFSDWSCDVEVRSNTQSTRHKKVLYLAGLFTINLDPVSEAQVLNGLLSHRQGATTILISHRPKVINCAEIIVLLDQGKLKLQGSLAELRSQPGEHLDFLIP